MADQFPQIGVPQAPGGVAFPSLVPPTPGSQLRDFPQSQPIVTSPAGPAVAPPSPGIDPNLLAAMLQFSGAALKPAGPGESPLSVIGGALGGAAQSFAKRAGEQDTRAVARERTEEQKRQDVETNPVEQSLIDYRASLGNAALKTAKAKGMTEAQFKENSFQRLKTSLMDKHDLDEREAVLAIEIGESTDWENIPAVAKRAIQKAAAEAGAFEIEDTVLAGQTFEQEGIAGIGKQTFNPQLVQKFNSSPDADIVQISNDPTLQQKAINAVGEATFFRRLSEAQRNAGN